MAIEDGRVDCSRKRLEIVAGRSDRSSSLVVSVGSSHKHVEATAPLANVGRGNIGLGHAVQRTLDDIYRVVVLVWILFVVDIGKHAVGRRILLIN